jgi:hypothetical protein
VLSEYLAVEPEKRDEIREKVRRILQKRIIVDNADIKERDKRGRAVYDLLMEVLPDLAHESQRLTQNQLSKLRGRLIDAAQTNDEGIFQEIQRILNKDYKNFAVHVIEEGNVTNNQHHISLVDIRKSLCQPDEQGCAALPVASMNGYHKFALRLHEEYGAESDALDVTGVTPFSYAAASCQLLQKQVNEERNLNMLLLKSLEGDELTLQEQQQLAQLRQRKALQRVASHKLSSKATAFESVKATVPGPALAHASAPMHHVQHVSAERKDNRRIGSERAVATVPSVLRSGQTTAHELAQPRMPHSQPRIKYIPRGQLGQTNRSPNVPLLTRH